MEHIVPQVNRGSNDQANLAWSCQGCNQHKFTAVSGMDPLTARKVRLYHPRLLLWSNHFEWSEDRLRMVGKTPTGRATIERLKLNRIGLVNLRGSLMATNNQPPPDD